MPTPGYSRPQQRTGQIRVRIHGGRAGGVECATLGNGQRRATDGGAGAVAAFEERRCSQNRGRRDDLVAILVQYPPVVGEGRPTVSGRPLGAERRPQHQPVAERAGARGQTLHNRAQGERRLDIAEREGVGRRARCRRRVCRRRRIRALAASAEAAAVRAATARRAGRRRWSAVRNERRWCVEREQHS